MTQHEKERWHPAICRTARYYRRSLPTWYDAEDLAQDLSLQLWEKGHAPYTQKLTWQVLDILKWLYGYAGQRRNREIVQDLWDVEGADSVEERVQIRLWFASLSERHRRIVMLSVLRGRKEAMQDMHITKGRVAQILGEERDRLSQ